MSKSYRNSLLTTLFLVAISTMLSGVFETPTEEQGWKPTNSGVRFAELVRDPAFREALRASRSVPPLRLQGR